MIGSLIDVLIDVLRDASRLVHYDRHGDQVHVLGGLGLAMDSSSLLFHGSAAHCYGFAPPDRWSGNSPRGTRVPLRVLGCLW